MKIKEIEMDLPYQKCKKNIEEIETEQKLGYDEAIRQDYELNWKNKRRRFQIMTRCMTSMIERNMPLISTKDCWKILIECVEKDAMDGCKNLLGVYTIQIVMDIERFFQLGNYEKKELVIYKIIDAIHKLSSYSGMDLTDIEKTCNEIVIQDYINAWFWKKPLKLKGKMVQIKVEHDIKELNLYMIFSNYDGNIIKQIHLITTIPDERVYSSYLGNLEWISENSAILTTKLGEILIGECN